MLSAGIGTLSMSKTALSPFQPMTMLAAQGLSAIRQRATRAIVRFRAEMPSGRWSCLKMSF
jgi:hypothetical protein